MSQEKEDLVVGKKTAHGRTTLILISIGLLLIGIGTGFGFGWMARDNLVEPERCLGEHPKTGYSSSVTSTTSTTTSTTPKIPTEAPTTTQTPDDGSCLEQIIDIIQDENGWITWLRRVDNSTNFTRTWDEYGRGFGNPDGNYWLGLKTLHQLTGKDKKYKMRIELESYEGEKEWAEYGTFSVAGEESKYQLSIGDFSGTTWDAFNATTNVNGILHGMYFSTWDNDNDKGNTHCVMSQGGGGGWWYNVCGYVYLTAKHGEFDSPVKSGHMAWYCAFGFCSYKPVKYAEAKIKLL